MAVRRSEKDVIGLEQHAFLAVHHRHARLAADYLRHQAAVARIDVLNDDDRRAQLRGQPGKQKAQGVDAAGRGGDGDDLERAWLRIRMIQSGPRLRPPCITAARIFQ